MEPLLGGILEPDRFGQIGREIGWFQSFYHTQPKVFIGYDRTAFAGREDPELRITFDTGLRWRDTDLDLRLGDQGAPLLGPDQVLMEIKIPGTCHLLDRAGARPVSFSKYGTCYQQHILPRIRAEQQNHQNNHHRQEEIRCA